MRMSLLFNRKYKKVPVTLQRDKTDCAPACLSMIYKYYGRQISLEYIRNACYLRKGEVSIRNLIIGAEKLGFEVLAGKITWETLISEGDLPCILLWEQNHYVVLERIKKRKVVLIDPGVGRKVIKNINFINSWSISSDRKGIAIFLKVTDNFHKTKEDFKTEKSLFSIFHYLKEHKKYIYQIFFGMIVTSIISLLFPILTQRMIDKGVMAKNLSIVYLILISQFMLFLGSTAIGFVRNWLTIHINSRISLTIISDFLKKLFVQPISFFESKSIGDITQRIADHHRIDTFLTGASLNTLFSIVNIIVLTAAIYLYNFKILLVFIFLSSAAVYWIFFFQKSRKELDNKKFTQQSENQEQLYEMIMGMQEIKLNKGEEAKRIGWETQQIKYFLLNFASLKIDQFQQSGFYFFTTLKNIVVSFIAAKEVISNNLTLGGLLSISYIIGQTNGPLEQISGFISAAQDSKLSFDRLNEITELKNKNENNVCVSNNRFGDIRIENLSFQYEGPTSPMVLSNINCIIPKGKTTAIIGESGSGKSTLMKLILNFYEPTMGSIFVDNCELNKMNIDSWRTKSGVVLQDGHIFSDSIQNNIALDGKPIDIELMNQATKIANLDNFVNYLPLKLNTLIGSSGLGISGGEKQRILIARAVYKTPEYLFFDEATSSLDSNNEKVIMENLHLFTKNKTVVVIAHRLSTVKSAEQIIVLNKGKIVEVGLHRELSLKKGKYFELVKNQLELGT